MSKLMLMLLLPAFVMGLSSCATPAPAVQPIEVQPAQLPPAPAQALTYRKRNFLERFLSGLSVSSRKPTESTKN